MASDLGVLLPTESQYSAPGAYTEAVRAEAQKQATYLSNMDQFYAQLDESKRQFDLNYSAREKEFSWTSQFEEKKLATETGLAERRLVMEEKQNDLISQIKQKELQFAETQLGFERERIGFEKEKLQAELDMMRQQIGLKEQEFSLQRELGLGQLELGKFTAQSQSAYQQGSLALEQDKLNAQVAINASQLTSKSPIQPSSILTNYYAGPIGAKRYAQDFASINSGNSYSNYSTYQSGTSAYQRALSGNSSYQTAMKTYY